MDTTSERIARGMVESTTEYDLEDLPDNLRSQLIEWAGRFAAWVEPRIVKGEIV